MNSHRTNFLSHFYQFKEKSSVNFFFHLELFSLQLFLLDGLKNCEISILNFRRYNKFEDKSSEDNQLCVPLTHRAPTKLEQNDHESQHETENVAAVCLFGNWEPVCEHISVKSDYNLSQVRMMLNIRAKQSFGNEERAHSRDVDHSRIVIFSIEYLLRWNTMQHFNAHCSCIMQN